MGNLELPYFTLHFGILLSLIIFILTYYLMIVSCKLLTLVSFKTKMSDYSKIALHCFGYLGLVSHFAIITYNFGCTITFVNIYFTSMRKLLILGLKFEENSFTMNFWF